jgi:RND family efflux transporter MFP subunit
MNTSKGKLPRRSIYLIGGVFLVVAILGLYLVNRRAAASRSDFTQRVATITSVTVTNIVQTSGTLNAAQSASLNWKTTGAIQTINVKVGDQVHKGDVLAALDSSSIPQSVITAQADLIPAQQELEDIKASDTGRAQALVDLTTAQKSYEAALNSRRSLNGIIQLTRYEYVWRGNRQVLKTTYYKGYADAAMLANADNNVALAKAKLDDATKAYERIKNGANPANLASAQARVDAARAAFNTVNITAPFDGDILAIYNQANDLVDTSSPAIILANRQTYQVTATVDETEISRLEAGQPVEVKLDAVPDITLEGQVESVSLFGQSVSGIVKYDIFVSVQSKDVELPLGATANLTIQIGKPASSLAVPITAVYSDDKGDYVLVVAGGGSQQRVDVQSGDIIGNLVAISGSLKEGDRVLLAQSAATSNSPANTTQRQRPFFGP